MKTFKISEEEIAEFEKQAYFDSLKYYSNGKYGTYEELSKKYEDLLKLLDTSYGRLAYQNMMLDKAREAYEYITAEDRDKEI